jgi:hypothetical protein
MGARFWGAENRRTERASLTAPQNPCLPWLQVCHEQVRPPRSRAYCRADDR